MSRKSKKRSPAAAGSSSSSPAPPSSEAPTTTDGNGGLIAARLFLALALAVSFYLAWVSLSHGTAIGCGPESDCDRVLGSRWARWFGIPVSVFAVLVDGLALWGTFQIGRALSPERTARGWLTVMLGAWLILGGAAWFVALQAFAVGWCPYCMTAHACGVVAAVLLLARARQSALPAGLTRRVATFGAMAFVFLVAGQVGYRPRTGREIKNFAASTNFHLIKPVPPTTAVANADSAVAHLVTSRATNAAVPPGPATVNAGLPSVPVTNPSLPVVMPAPSTNSVAAAPPQVFTPGATLVSDMKRPFKFHDGKAALDLLDVPVIGSPTNKEAILSLFDYTCHHCREMHSLLVEAQRTFSNQLVIASLPMPLDASCNRTMSRTPRAHTNACEYARLGLIVWRANRERHRDFDEFLMAGAEIPPLSAAVGRAVQLLGTNALLQASADPWVEQRLQFSLALYEFAYSKGEGRMPQMIVGRNVAVGTYPRDEMFKLLADNLDLKKTP